MNNNIPRTNILSKLKETSDSWFFNPPISFKILARVKEFKCWELSSSPCTMCSSCLRNTLSSSLSFDLTCLQKRCVSLYYQSQLQGCLVCYSISAVSSRCLQQAISHSPVTERLRTGTEALGCAAPLPSAGVLSGDASWGPSSAMGHCPMPPCWGRALPHEIHPGAVRTPWKRDYMKGDYGDGEGHLVISWSCCGGGSNLNQDIFLQYNRDCESSSRKPAHGDTQLVFLLSTYRLTCRHSKSEAAAFQSKQV